MSIKQGNNYIAGGGGTGAWGSITGTLSNQTDLQNALNAKQDVATAVNYNNISNCITEIPQDIKLELNNGTLTLKAGSKLYYPDGLDINNNPKFTTRITTEDYVANGQYGYEEAPHILCLNNASYWVTPHFAIVFSGTTAPTGYQFMLWYDTANNIVKWTNNSGSTWSVQDCSLPFGMATYNGGSYANGFKRIDQIFNGFGYMGSTVFALPGVKGLIPQGRNADGSLKNTEITLSNVITYINSNYNTKGMYLGLKENSIMVNNWFVSQEENPQTTYTIWYKPSENILYYSSSTTAFSKLNFVVFGQIDKTAGATMPILSNFKPKTAFHAVDYNDFENLTIKVLEAVYPVGSIYIGTTSTCPLASLFGTWTSVSSGRVLQGSSTGHNAGTTIEAGLPNITGCTGMRNNGLAATTTGAFWIDTSSPSGSYANEGYYAGAQSVSIDASRSNSIYGNSSTVQPPAYVVNIWQRTA